ncbi:probable G-protein coupled receptor frpr-1 isoform X1 [Anthonomus grandis grandis]|uniref:probable G-protein coupled receptor frpr-1 isoform X1 n=1 Tax=Anthonomus grandis grandis TaxID=2921223 RepID=UPI002165EDCB|nr:probable G-protein coupled receptor frpr-1 isoform X1 [Anthonomus grandis grandis]
MSFYFFTSAATFRGEADVWSDSPTPRGKILYSVVTPILCCFGIFGNVVSLMVLKRKELVGSVYTYLAILACVDLTMSIILLFGGISRGVMWKYGWNNYDAILGISLGSAVSTLGQLAIVTLTIDRVIYLWNPVQCTKPKFCKPRAARRNMIFCLFVALLSSLPYCFVYKWGDNGSLETTPFFDSRFYKAFNWFTLFAFAVIPTIILLLGNGFLIMSLRKAKIINKRSNKCRTSRCKRRDHTNLTITLVMIIIMFLITNLPESLVSRATAINLLFNGNHTAANNAVTLENIRQVCTILSAIDVNTNFIFYYTFCPAFCNALKNICRCKQRRLSNLQVNVFVLNSADAKPKNLESEEINKKVQKVLAISRKSIESAIAFNLDVDGSNKDFQSHGYAFSPGEYVEIENDYTPPFSTILEESSVSSNSSSKQMISNYVN